MKNIFIVLFSVFLVISCKPQENDKIKIVTKAEFKTAIESDVQLVDVRTPQEFKDGYIKNAININIYDADFETKIQSLDKTKPVYVYCKSGGRSQQAAHKMIDLGFTEVIDLQGGYMAWDK